MIDLKIIEQRLSIHILSFTRLSGGDINDVFVCKTATDKFVVKANEKHRFPKMLKKEAKGLELLHKATVCIPELIDQFDSHDRQYLILEWIEEESTHGDFWLTFGRDLSRLHQQSSPSFGLEYNNFIGSLDQKNQIELTWETFFVEKRLIPLVKKAFEKGLLDSGHLKKFQKLYIRISELIPKEKPSLLHGDLWSGNLLCGKGQQAVFIDPAVYYGHREMDIAMTFMFGGFNQNYLLTYNEAFPLETGWENRIGIHNLYPLLVHLNLFGASYRGRIEKVLSTI